jgi:hypothetical protein
VQAFAGGKEGLRETDRYLIEAWKFAQGPIFGSAGGEKVHLVNAEGGIRPEAGLEEEGSLGLYSELLGIKQEIFLEETGLCLNDGQVERIWRKRLRNAK